VDAGTWDYLNSRWIAERYESYFAGHPLFAVDQALLQRTFGSPDRAKVVVDLGCGNGRALLPLVAAGFSGLAVDLSVAMLQEVRRAAERLGVEVPCVQANLVELDGIAAASCDHGMCLFSTLGMIQGRVNRVQALRHFRRIIKPGGRLVLHVHNYWYNLQDPGGPWWLMGNLFRSIYSKWLGDGRIERGDKHYPYRGLQNMFLHVFTRGELTRDLQQAGWQTMEFLPLQPRTMQPWTDSAWLKDWRAVGWIVIVG
jgi:SAM-dependent methyltransferase